LIPRLLRTFDLGPLLVDLEAADLYAWGARPHPGWSTLGLRTPSGDVEDAGQAPGRDTELLKRCPAFAAVLAELGAKNARLSVLAPGGRILEHRDVSHPRRVHVPLVTSPAATVMIDRVVYRWPAGEAWEADFSRPHSAANTGLERRVHLLVII
jgi:aspartyl/asparaginyl beta-hydroxylase (cupin superfamily)